MSTDPLLKIQDDLLTTIDLAEALHLMGDGIAPSLPEAGAAVTTITSIMQQRLQDLKDDLAALREGAAA